MTTIRVDIQSLQQLIRELSRPQREELAEWILNSADADWQVREAAREPGGPVPTLDEVGPDAETGALEAADATVVDRYRGCLISVDEYLQMETGGVRYEYISGQIFAIASPLIRHELIVNNLTYQFQNKLRGGSCRAWSSNAAVRIETDLGDIFYMPDVSISCGQLTGDVLGRQYLTDPRVVVEVVSPSTESTDRREKARNYRYLPSVEEILLIAQRTMEVTVLRRIENWKPKLLTLPQDVFESRAVDVRVTLSDIYDGTR